MGTEYVETSATGSVSVVPDRAVLRLRFVHTADQVAPALDACATTVTAALAALDETAGDGHVRQTGSIGVSDHWDQQRQRPHGYDAEQTLVVRLDEPARIGAVIADVSQAAGDAFRMNGLSWETDDVVSAEREARDLAVAAARAKAEQLAAAGGRALGAVLRISEGSFGSVARPMAMKAMAFDAEVMPVEAGESEVRVDVTARWQLVDA